MNDAAFKHQMARVEKIHQHWAYTLGLRNWSIQRAYHRGPFSDKDNEEHHSIAECKSDWRYLHAIISWDLTEIEDLDDEALEGHVVHELMHVFLEELRHPCDDFMAHEERIASSLAQAFIWVRNVERKERQKHPKEKPT